MFHQKWILSPQDLLQNRSLETVSVCIVWQYYPHSNTVCIHMCDGCKISNDLIVCHRLWSILWSIVQVCLFTDHRNQVFQYVPSTSISEPFVSILLTILPRISILLLWNDGHQCMEWIHCRVVESFFFFADSQYRSTHFFAWSSISWDHEEKRRFSEYGSFSVHPRKFWIQTWFCNCQQYLCLFHIVFEWIPSVHDQWKMLVLPNRLLY